MGCGDAVGTKVGRVGAGFLIVTPWCSCIVTDGEPGEPAGNQTDFKELMVQYGR